MNKQLTIAEAQRLNQEGIKRIGILEADNPRAEEFMLRMVSHSELVAVAAQKIAEKIPDMDADKAYIYGLLHDYGKYFGDVLSKRTFHGLIGYQKLMGMGYFDVAKINLTHTFLQKDFEMSEYVAYNRNHLLTTKEILATMEFDDYDRLLQLTDLLPQKYDGYEGVRVRFIRLKRVYNMADEVVEKRIKEAMRLKEYFDKKGNIDIYKMLEITDV